MLLAKGEFIFLLISFRSMQNGINSKDEKVIQSIPLNIFQLSYIDRKEIQFSYFVERELPV